jgi:AbrB family looped-hinge helix DNA binding protein
MASMGFEIEFEGSVTVGERGQVVIPAHVRELRGIQAGDKLLVFCHPNGCGIVLIKFEDLQRINEVLGPILRSAEDEAEGSETPAATDGGTERE